MRVIIPVMSSATRKKPYLSDLGAPCPTVTTAENVKTQPNSFSLWNLFSHTLPAHPPLCAPHFATRLQQPFGPLVSCFQQTLHSWTLWGENFCSFSYCLPHRSNFCHGDWILTALKFHWLIASPSQSPRVCCLWRLWLPTSGWVRITLQGIKDTATILSMKGFKTMSP